jgi:predicted O-methyltransferase YrrM
MDRALRALLDELAAFGRENDERETARERRMLNITPDTGRLLAILARSTGARRVLEVGASNGYSTIWLADAARDTGGHVTTIERSPEKAASARANLSRAGLTGWVTLHEGDAHVVLAELSGAFDLIFLDADRASYHTYLERLLALLRPGGLLVTDNAVSHAEELVEFLARIRADDRLDSVTLPIGNGEELTYKRISPEV